MAKTGNNGGGKSAAQLKRERNKRIRSIVILVICIILALSMTIPSVGLILGGNGAGQEEDADGTAANANATMLETSQAYEATFADLKAAQAEAEDPSSYDATFVSTYHNWAAALMQGPSNDSSATIADIDASYQLLLDSIAESQEASESPDDYLAAYTYAYYCKAYSYMLARQNTNTDMSEAQDVVYGKAISYGEEALAAAYDEDVAVNVATVHYWQGDTQAAIDTLISGTEQLPDSPVLWYYLGTFYNEDGNTDAARQALEQALAVDPEDTYGYAASVNSLLESL